MRALKAFKILPYALGIAMGILLLTYGGYLLYKDVYVSIEPSSLIVIAHIIMTISGLFIIIVGRRDLIRCIGLYAVSLGLSRFALRLDILDFDDMVPAAINCVMILLAINLMYTGASFCMGRVIRRLSMSITSIILAMIDLLMLVTDGSQSVLPFTPYIDTNTRFVECIMYLVLLILLDTEFIRYGTSEGRIVTHLTRIRENYRMDDDAHINPIVAENLLNRDGNLWIRNNDGPVEREMTFTITGNTMEANVTAQIWKGHDGIYLTISSNPGSIIHANRIKVDVVRREGNVLHMYGKDGTDFIVGLSKGARS